jgi:lipase chaperone LimK
MPHEIRTEIRQRLASVAASQALELLQRVTDYRTAVQQMLPRESAPTTVAEARSMLETVHGMRIDYLGEDAARTFFAQEEKLARAVIESAVPKPNSQRTAAEQASDTTMKVRTAFAMFIMPRQPPRAIGQQDP